MEKTPRELIREIMADHPRHIFYDGPVRGKNPLTAREAMKLQEEYERKKERTEHE